MGLAEYEKIGRIADNPTKELTGATGQIAVPKKAIAVVIVVRNMAPPASGKAMAAIVSVSASGFSIRAFFHLSTATKISSAPRAKTTKTPIKFKKGKNSRPPMSVYTKKESGKLRMICRRPIEVMKRLLV